MGLGVDVAAGRLHPEHRRGFRLVRRDSSREQPRSTDPINRTSPTGAHRAGGFETRSIAGAMGRVSPSVGIYGSLGPIR